MMHCLFCMETRNVTCQYHNGVEHWKCYECGSDWNTLRSTTATHEEKKKPKDNDVSFLMVSVVGF